MDALESLVVSGKELDRELLGNVLTPFVRLEQDTCKIRPTPQWKELTQQAQVLVYLLSRKAMKALDFAIDSEEASPTTIGAETGMGRNATAHLSNLYKSKLVDKTAAGKYFVPNYSLEAVKDVIQRQPKEA